ncbi:MAG: ABC transporter ATP-binding protein [Rhodospirillales bacterium]|nr:ABC transporter ATP-binding protein [Rhodospirillales bacterium]
MNPLLETRELRKSYGALVVTDAVAFDILPNEIHALIGPNGAGKSSFLAQLAGDVLSDSGRILFEERDITDEPAERRAHLGIARSYQIARLFEEMSVRANVALAVQACSPWARALGRPAAGRAELIEPADAQLERVGLADRARAPAGSLAHGERRKLELAMAMAAKPRLLLLDEPLAGMGVDESHATIALLDRLRAECAIVLVEHDVNAVFGLSDRISVLVHGRLIASGPPAAIRADAAVRQAYLGDLAQEAP